MTKCQAQACDKEADAKVIYTIPRETVSYCREHARENYYNNEKAKRLKIYDS